MILFFIFYVLVDGFFQIGLQVTFCGFAQRGTFTQKYQLNLDFPSDRELSGDLKCPR
jgi:hypothetical protein